jgi:hypothetical protein
MKPAPTSICLPKRLCCLCMRYRSPLTGCRNVAGRPFICAECNPKRSAA